MLVTYAIIGCILLLTIGAILCFPGPAATPAGSPPLRCAARLVAPCVAFFARGTDIA